MNKSVSIINSSEISWEEVSQYIKTSEEYKDIMGNTQVGEYMFNRITSCNIDLKSNQLFLSFCGVAKVGEIGISGDILEGRRFLCSSYLCGEYFNLFEIIRRILRSKYLTELEKIHGSFTNTLAH